MNGVKYYVGSAEQTFWRRVYPTKTFKLAATAFLGVVLDAMTAGVVVASWKGVLGAAVASATVVTIRDAIAKLTLASNAADENITNVVAVQK